MLKSTFSEPAFSILTPSILGNFNNVLLDPSKSGM